MDTTFMEELGLVDQEEMMNQYLKWYSHSNSMPVRDWLKDWYEGKSNHLFKMFDNQLIYKQDFSYNKNINEIYTQICDISIYHDLTYDWQFIINSILSKDNRPHDNFYKEIVDVRYYLNQCLGVGSLARNAIGCDCTYVNDEIGIKITLQNGEKPLKAIKRIVKTAISHGLIDEEFANKFNSKAENFRIAHSQCLNDKTVKGKLCISIHPFDYITMSDNASNWSSCMNWTGSPAGGSRAGTIEMMNSKYVVVAYIEGNKPYYPCGNKYLWNDKKWRQLFVVDELAIVGIKQYPYVNTEAEQLAFKMLKDLARKNLGWNYQEEIMDLDQFDETEEYSHIRRFDIDTNLMYNDINSHSTILLNKDFKEKTEDLVQVIIDISGPAKCTVCGRSIDSEDTTLCDNCDNHVYCQYCGDRLDPDYAIYIDGDHYCEYCYDNYVEEHYEDEDEEF